MASMIFASQSGTTVAGVHCGAIKQIYKYELRQHNIRVS
jgi:hypothetical protein